MAQTVRVEFVRLALNDVPSNIIRDIEAPAINNLSVGNTATGAGSRPQVPSGGVDGMGCCVRLICTDNPVFVAWGADPTATLTNSVKLIPAVPEVIYMKDGSLMSFIAENP